MNSRDAILASVRANLPKARPPLPEIPNFARPRTEPLIEQFGRSLARMGGRLIAIGPASDSLAPLRGELAESRLVCSATREVKGARDLMSVVNPADLAEVDHAVVRARLGVAETGSVLFTDDDLKINALAYLAQHLLVLLDPADVVTDLHEAYRRPEFCERPYAVFHTGPSATADIEGVLILGAQGVRSLSVLLAPRLP
jgi:L-lactate dehydrogenase complex protein LldG